MPECIHGRRGLRATLIVCERKNASANTFDKITGQNLYSRSHSGLAAKQMDQPDPVARVWPNPHEHERWQTESNRPQNVLHLDDECSTNIECRPAAISQLFPSSRK